MLFCALVPSPGNELQAASMPLIPPATQADEGGKRNGDGEADDEASAIIITAGVPTGAVKPSTLSPMLRSQCQ